MTSGAQQQKTPHNLRQGKDAFAGLITEDWQAIDAVASAHIYPAGTELFQQGASVREMYFIDQGLVKLTREEADGEEMIVDLRFPG